MSDEPAARGGPRRPAEDRRERRDELVRAKHSPGHDDDVALPRRRERQRFDRRAPRRRRPGRLEADPPCGPGRLVDRRQRPGGSRGGVGRRHVPHRHGRRFPRHRRGAEPGRVEHGEEPVARRAHLEEVEEPLEGLAIRVPQFEGGERDSEGDVAHERRQPQVRPHLLLVDDERFAQFRRALREVGVEPVEVVVGGDELGGRLLADTRDPRQVVRRVAPQRREQRVVGRGHAGARDDARLVVEDVVGHATPVVEHAHVRILDELERVAVPRHDDDVVRLVPQPRRQRGEDVVRLVADGVDGGDAEGRDELPDQFDLLDERLGSRRAARLVVGDEGIAERRLVAVEGDRHPVGTEVGEHLRRHRDEAVHGLGLLARRRLHARVLQREPGPEGEAVPVEE